MVRNTQNTCFVNIKPGGLQNRHWACKGYQLLAHLRSEINRDSIMLWYNGRSIHRRALFAIPKVNQDSLSLIPLQAMKTEGSRTKERITLRLRRIWVVGFKPATTRGTAPICTKYDIGDTPVLVSTLCRTRKSCVLVWKKPRYQSCYIWSILPA
jgi:hypothetical protein